MPMFVDKSPPGECIFCKLVAGEIPSAKVFEDVETMAFMDLGQVNPGHTLIAVKRYQWAKGLRGDGIAGTKTLASLNGD